MVSPSLSATLVAIATILNCSDGFVTPKSPSINIGSTTAGSNTLPRQSCNNIIFSSTPKLCLLTPPTTTTTSLYSTQQEASTPTDGETLQTVFSTYSDDNNLMSKDQLKSIPSISEMLAEGDLLSSELDDMWDAVVSNKSDDKIDVDGFVQVYKDIDDLFEDEGEEEEEGVDDATLAAVSAALAAASGADETELAQAFDTLKDGGDGSSNTISFTQLRQWEEITSLVSEGMLGEDEFKSLWESSGDDADDDMDLERFLKFNNALDDLFVFDEDEEVDEEISSDMVEEEEEETEEEEDVEVQQQQLPVITETDLPPAVLFSQLANENYLVGEAELKRWGELQDMISQGDLSQEELDVLVGRAEKAPGTDGMYVDEEGFCKLAEAIDDLFEDVDDTAVDEPEQQEEDFRELKVELLELLEDIDKIGEEEGRLLCGLDCNELEQERVLEVVGEIERETYNKVVAASNTGGGAVSKDELLGEWELLYSSSSTMKYNEGLSGLAGGLTRFGGLKQKIIGTKYLSDVEYTEQVVGKLGGKSYEVKITGDWEMKTELSLFTGKPANVMSVTPDNVVYGPRRDKADHWKSLGPMNMLLLSYIDEDLRIMRGNTSTDTLFIWKRC
ncbi:hypothetical protein QTG54_007576 [Skeletonema marinoi]|uniref:Plastid lipid-associated protein/fibrillin conserved domain-containing protein n=1 Tax=Skeletonema marinoi TaxID=267567 RepID=A0AAD9DDT1_9STRA|nr:hypothetical protein QTG54_007576 [Skeletonema marinoi]